MNIEIANRLVNLRKEMGLSQEQLAEKIGVSRQAVSKWERSEASPDTDNIILLARLYNISLDELLRTEDDIPQAEETAEEAAEETTEEPEASGFEQADAETAEETTEENADGYYKEAANGDKVHIGLGGIDVHDRHGSKVHVGFDGIFVNDAQNGDNVQVSKDGVFVNDKQYTKEELKNWHKNHNVFAVPIVMLSIIAFISFGFCGFFGSGNGWSWSWLFLFAIPILCSLESAIRNKKPENFAYPVLMAFFFLASGIFYNAWHPAWTMFITIPLYYIGCDMVKGKKSYHYIYPVLISIAYIVAGYFWSLWHPGWILFLTIPIYYWIVDLINEKKK